MTPLLSSKQAATHLGVSDDFLRARVKAGELASYRFGRVLKFSTADLDDFAERQRVPAVPPPVARRARPSGRGASDAAVAAFGAGDYKAFVAATRGR